MFGLRFKQVEAISLWDEGETTVEIKSKPWLTEWADLLLRQVRAEFHPRALGYRFLEHDPSHRVNVYARPLLVWLYLWLCLSVGRAFWWMEQVLYQHDIIHFRTPEAMRVRWRDLGLGPDPRCRGCWWWPRKDDPWMEARSKRKRRST